MKELLAAIADEDFAIVVVGNDKKFLAMTREPRLSNS
jgi:hypothetical protein